MYCAMHYDVMHTPENFFFGDICNLYAAEFCRMCVLPPHSVVKQEKEF